MKTSRNGFCSHCHKCEKQRIVGSSGDWYYTEQRAIREQIDGGSIQKYYFILCKKCYTKLLDDEKIIWQPL